MGLGISLILLGWLIKEKMGIPIPKLIQAPLIWITAYIMFRFILQPPIPFSLLAIYMAVVTIACFLYVSLSQPSWEEFTNPIKFMLQEDSGKAKMSRYFTFAAIPLLLAYGTYNKMLPKFDEPIELRTVHPAPPASINVHDKILNLQTAENPYRIDDSGKYLKVGLESVYHGKNPFAEDAPKFLQNVRDGEGSFSEPPDVFSVMGIILMEEGRSLLRSILFRRISQIRGRSPSFRRPSSSGVFQKAVLDCPVKRFLGPLPCLLGKNI